MKKLLIVGAGGHGRCVCDCAELLGYEDIAFLDDSGNKEVFGYQVIGKVCDLEKFSYYENCVIAIGNNELRVKLINKASSLGFNLVVLIHPSAVVSKHSVVADGTVIFANAVVQASSIIKKGCIISSNVTIEHDVEIDEGCLIYSNVTIRPLVKMDKYVKVDANRCIYTN